MVIWIGAGVLVLTLVGRGSFTSASSFVRDPNEEGSSESMADIIGNLSRGRMDGKGIKWFVNTE